MDHLDCWREQAELARACGALLEASGIEYCRLPEVPGHLPCLVVSVPDAAAALRALRALPSDVQARLEDGDRPLAQVTGLPSGRLVLWRRLGATNGEPLTDADVGVALEAWRVTTAPGRRRDGGQHPSGTRIAVGKNGVVDYLEPDQWQLAQTAPSRWPRPMPPHLFTVTEPIDLVYTWVDGTDPAWRERQAAARNRATGHHTDAFSDSRFADHDELRYSLRSAEQNANWFRHVYLVTDGQRPAWLKADHPRLSVVEHREIFTDPSALPVFNSHAIESQLHHIPGLSRRFLYLNDDVFFTRPVRPEAFFHGNGLLKLFVSGAMVSADDADPRDLPVLAAAKRSRDLIERDFHRTFTARLQHTQLPQDRQLLDELEARYPAVFDAVMRSKFRHPDDYAVSSSLAQYYGYATGRAVSGEIGYGYVDISRSSTAAKLTVWARSRPFDVLCLNDTDNGDLSSAQRDSLVREYLSTCFPLPSTFEA